MNIAAKVNTPKFYERRILNEQSTKPLCDNSVGL